MNANELADELENKDRFWNVDENLMLKTCAMLRQQQAEIDVLKKFIAESNALDKKLHESIQKSNEVWGKATKSILKKAQKK